MIKLLLSILAVTPVICQAQISSRPTSNSSPLSAQKGYIYTDKGTPIEVFKVDKNNLSLTNSNSNGWTFTNNEFYINNNQVPIIIKDEYKEISFDKINDGDILVRYDTNGNVKYTLTACTPSKKSGVCENKPHPILFLFVLTKDAKINNPQTMKIYRHI